jgi:hypothetical protein
MFENALTRYQKTEKYKAYKKKYSQRPDVKEKHRKNSLRYYYRKKWLTELSLLGNFILKLKVKHFNLKIEEEKFFSTYNY